MTYNPADWYWVVAGSTTQVFSSNRASYVALSDTTYIAWLAEGNLPTKIAADGELTDVLIKANLPWSVAMHAGQTDLGVLTGAEAALVLQCSGLVLTFTGTPSLDGTYALDPGSIANLNGVYLGVAVGAGFPGGGSTFSWPDVTETLHSFTTTNFTNFGLAVRNYLYELSQAAITDGPWPSNAVTIA
jgi:hypothetical protein